MITVLACWGALIIGAIYMLRAVRNILHADLSDQWSNVTDASSFWRKLPFALLIGSLLVFGCFPRLLTEKLRDPVNAIVQMANPVLNTASTTASVDLQK